MFKLVRISRDQRRGNLDNGEIEESIIEKKIQP